MNSITANSAPFNSPPPDDSASETHEQDRSRLLSSLASDEHQDQSTHMEGYIDPDLFSVVRIISLKPVTMRWIRLCIHRIDV